MKIISTPLKKSEIAKLKAGDDVFLSGIIYTGRDQAHKRLTEALKRQRKLPVDLKGQVIYYCGPTATPPGKVIGSAGPTTSLRMDEFVPDLLKAGLSGMIGKGSRSQKTVQAIKKYKAVYFLTYAGCGALLTRFIKKAKVIAYPELGPEAIYELEVENLPLIVAIDAKGKDIYGKK